MKKEYIYRELASWLSPVTATDDLRRITLLDKNAEIIKDSLEFRDVAESYGLKFNREGFALCPFHNEKTASFRVYDKRYGHCFGCGWHGDVISFTEQLYNLKFGQAKRKLAEDFAVPVIFDRKMTVSESSNALANYNRDIMEYNKRVQDDRRKKKHLEDLLWIYETLRNWKEWYEPKNMDEIDDHYVKAVSRIDEAKWMLTDFVERNNLQDMLYAD